MVAKKKPQQNEAVETLDRYEPSISGYLSTGCTILDLAIADQLPGGFPQGKISHIFGMESTAKTVFMQEPLGAAQRKGGMAGVIDAEETFDFDRAELFGVTVPADPYSDTESWRYRTCNTIEELFEKHFVEMAKACDPKKPNAIGVDSLSSISSLAEMKEKMEKGSYGTSRAKQMSAAFRKYIGMFRKANLAVIFIDQSRQNIGAFYGQPEETVSGGNALKFYSSVRVHMRHEGKIKNRNGVIIGVRFGFEVVKNKCAPPFREGSLNLLFDYGIDDVTTSVEWIQEHTGNADKATLRCKDCGKEVIVNADVKGKDKQCPDCGGSMAKVRRAGGVELLGQKFNTVGDAVRYVEAEHAEKALQQEVWDLWRELHRTEERATKQRD